MRKRHPNTLVILIAIVACAGIITLKFAVSALSGSSPTFSEGTGLRP